MLWIPSPGADSLKMVVSDSGYTNDTVEFSLKPREVNLGRNRSKEKEEIIPKLVIKHNMGSARIKPGRPIVFKFSEPVTDFNLDRIWLVSDSVMLKPDICI